MNYTQYLLYIFCERQPAHEKKKRKQYIIILYFFDHREHVTFLRVLSTSPFFLPPPPQGSLLPGFPWQSTIQILTEAAAAKLQ